MVIDAKAIYKAEHDLIGQTYDWLNDGKNKEQASQYILGVHDMALIMLSKLEETEKE